MASDVKGLQASKGFQLRRQIDPAEQDKKLHDVAKMYEQQFMREMVKAMRGTVPESGLIKNSQTEKIYKEQLDQQYVEKWSEKGGFGLGDMIYQQLKDKYGPQLGLTAKEIKPIGPIPLGKDSQFVGKLLGNSSQKNNLELSPQELAKLNLNKKIQIQFEKIKQEMNELPDLALQDIKAPWSGSVLGSTQINPNEYVLNLAHDNGLKSQFVFKGTLVPGQGQQAIQAGDTIGFLSPESRTFYWNIEKEIE